MYRTQKEAKLRTMFNSNYQLITVLPAWSLFEYHTEIGQELDDILFARYKDILVDPERYLTTLNAWLMIHMDDFTRVYEALNSEYDPLSNYDMIEKEGSVDLEGVKTTSAGNTSTSVLYGQEKTTQTIPETKSERYTTTYEDASTGRLEAYTENSITDAPTLDGHNAQVTVTEQIPETVGTEQKRGREIENTASSTEQYSGNVTIQAPESELEGDKGHSRELTRKGNIGVTTSQQMLESELVLRRKYNFCNYFCDVFSREMTLGVWDLC